MARRQVLAQRVSRDLLRRLLDVSLDVRESFALTSPYYGTLLSVPALCPPNGAAPVPTLLTPRGFVRIWFAVGERSAATKSNLLGLPCYEAVIDEEEVRVGGATFSIGDDTPPSEDDGPLLHVPTSVAAALVTLNLNNVDERVLDAVESFSMLVAGALAREDTAAGPLVRARDRPGCGCRSAGGSRRSQSAGLDHAPRHAGRDRRSRHAPDIRVDLASRGQGSLDGGL